MEKQVKKSPQIVQENMVVTISPKDVTIFQMIADGEKNDKIAKALELSKRTVETRISNTLMRTACRNRTEVVVLLMRNKLIK
jgi:DNA-binding NarL/FixJ family response regulator